MFGFLCLPCFAVITFVLYDYFTRLCKSIDLFVSCLEHFVKSLLNIYIPLFFFKTALQYTSRTKQVLGRSLVPSLSCTVNWLAADKVEQADLKTAS